MDLKDKSIHELRSIAQSFNIDDIFSKNTAQLIQEIEIKRDDLIPEPEVKIPPPEYDARLMTRPPSKRSSQDDVLELLSGHIQKGLIVTFPDEEVWEMSFGKKTDTGSVRMPLRVTLSCANKLMR